MVFDIQSNKKKIVIAMAHIGALPGSPLYDADGGVSKLIEGVLKDIDALQTGGVDAVMFGNENDRPYVLKAPPEGIAGMTAVVQAIKPHLKAPFGVNYLWDPLASVAIAAATGASFVREIFAGLFASDMGLWQGRLRRRPPAAPQSRPRRHERLLFSINAEFAHVARRRPIALRAKSAVFSASAGRHPGLRPLDRSPVDRSNLKTVRETVPTDVLVLASTPASPSTICATSSPSQTAW
jgi:membrane complex biogenesis BtpA family protein